MVAQRTVNPWPMAWRFESSPVQFLHVDVGGVV